MISMILATGKLSAQIGPVIAAGLAVAILGFDSTEIALAVIATIGTVGAAWLAARQRRSERAEDRAEQLVARMMDRLTQLEDGAVDARELLATVDDQLSDARRAALEYELGARTLLHQLREAGLDPRWEPPAPPPD